MFVHEQIKTVILRGYSSPDGYEQKLEYDWICSIDIHSDVAFVYGLKGILPLRFKKELLKVLKRHKVNRVMYERHGTFKFYNITDQDI